MREPGPGMRIARPFGIPVFISPYWFLIAGVFVILYARGLDESVAANLRYVVAAAFVVLLYASVLVHELSHSLVALAFGLPVRRILLYPLGGFSEIEREPPTPGREFLVSAAGPLISLALAAAGFGLDRAFHPDGVPGVLLIPLALFVRSGSQVQVFDALWLAVIAAFMWSGASQSLRASRVRERLPGLQARLLARRAIPIPSSLPLAEAIRRADAAQARALVIVDHEDRPIAIVSESAVMATPVQRRPWVDAGSLARTLDPGLVLSADLSGMALVEAVRRSPATEYLLVEPSGQVFGVLAAADLDHAFAGV